MALGSQPQVKIGAGFFMLTDERKGCGAHFGGNRGTIAPHPFCASSSKGYPQGMRAFLVLALACPLWADELTQQVTARLAEEADAFQRLAPKVLGKETLHQKALKAPSRFHMRVGDAAKKPPPFEWREREVVS